MPKIWLLPAVALLATVAHAQTLQGEALVKALRQGGYILVMRHTSSPREAPAKAAANPDNINGERQLDEEGRSTAVAMGQALRALRIPFGEVLSSPTYRALETVKYAQLGDAKTFPELGDNGQSMSGGTAAQAAWLRMRVTQFPSGGNTIMVTHFPNLTQAFPQWAAGVADGEALVLGPDGKGGAQLITRIKIEDWPRLR
jgi:phosphohistidine phosphatase SixA